MSENNIPVINKSNEAVTTYETKIGNTIFVLTSKCSPYAKETIEQKLERLIKRRASAINYYEKNPSETLELCEKSREHGLATNL